MVGAAAVRVAATGSGVMVSLAIRSRARHGAVVDAGVDGGLTNDGLGKLWQKRASWCQVEEKNSAAKIGIFQS